MQALDANGARLDQLESRAFEQSDDLRKLDVAVSVPEMSGEAPSRRLGFGEVHEEYPATGLEDSSQLGRKVSTGGATEVMKHHRAKRQIEARILERQCLGGCILEPDLDAGPRRLRTCSSQHLR